MKIDLTNNQPLVKKNDNNQGRLKLGQMTVDSPEAKEAASSDKVNISTSSKLYQRALDLATLAPDIRSEKVADLTAKIAAGNYRVSSEAVADSIIRKSVSEFV
ncbi:MAG: flagellar biosynthesis anti-sigma factor FlgM [Deltaproteobacteria bacterium]|jgi:negative regulator of flagellin synthesis FlgM|nr:flagellar biosynthesis anti-sigma factor FlgM [Deltaproteobacteria bacterium]